MPNTYVSLPGFDVDPLHMVSKKLREAKERIEYISSKLAARARLIDCYEGAFPWIKSYLIHPLFMHTLMSPKPFKAADSCISCGLCEKACPVRNIHLKERGKPEWGSHCTMCLACYHSCPKHAIEYSCLTQKKVSIYLISQIRDFKVKLVYLLLLVFLCYQEAGKKV